jgi:hypothetical protein
MIAGGWLERIGAKTRSSEAKPPEDRMMGRLGFALRILHNRAG